MEDILEKKGLKLEDLNAAEKETYFKMVEEARKGVLSLDKWREYLIYMRDEVSRELENEPEFIRVFIFKFENRQQILLKARLRNYRLQLAILESPIKARKALEEALANIK